MLGLGIGFWERAGQGGEELARSPSATFAFTNDTSDVDIAAPSEAMSGDTLYLLLVFENGTSPPTPSGFTSVRTHNNLQANLDTTAGSPSNATASGGIYTREHDGSAVYTITNTSSTGGVVACLASIPGETYLGGGVDLIHVENSYDYVTTNAEGETTIVMVGLDGFPGATSNLSMSGGTFNEAYTPASSGRASGVAVDPTPGEVTLTSDETVIGGTFFFGFKIHSGSPPPTETRVTFATTEWITEAPPPETRVTLATTEWVVQTPFPGTRATLATVEIIRQVA